MRQRFLLLTPVLNDWESLSLLIGQISQIVSKTCISLDIVAVDDGSTIPVTNVSRQILPTDKCIKRIEIIRLALNLGHQRAIAVGLASIVKRYQGDGVIVMDSDGEDRPEDIPRLAAAALANPDEIIVARRAKRSEATLFKVGYVAYKFLFRAVTGSEISFGNFSLLPMSAVRRLVHMPELWNNLPATIVRSHLRYKQIDTVRGVRFAGVSRMNFPSLVVLGLSAMSVYADIMFVRILMGASLVCGLSVIAMVIVVVIRLATTLAIPGWATNAFGNLFIVLFQALIIVVATTLMVLANRTSRPFVPISDTETFIMEKVTIMERAFEAHESVG